MRMFLIILPFFFFGETFAQNITLSDTTNQFDYVIITVPEFVSACETFKEHKETVRGLKTIIVDTTQIFAEFDSSMTPQENIRDFISYAGTFWKDPQPEYFLLVGNREKIPNFYMQLFSQYIIVSDFNYMNSVYNEDSVSTDFFVGRISAKEIGEINNYFSKVINYENNNYIDEWNNNILYLSQDNSSYDFDGFVFNLSSQQPSYFNNYFILENDTSEYHGNLDSLLYYVNDKEIGVICFSGFSNDSTFDGILNIDDIEQFQNDGKPFLSVFTSTQHFANITSNSINTKLLLNENGSLGGISSTSLIWWGASKYLTQKYFENLLLHNYSLGKCLDVEVNDLFQIMSKYSVNLSGDPSLKLKFDTTPNSLMSDENIPDEFSLKQNYPNPFNPETSIEFAIPNSGNVELKVYNVLGKEVKTLTNKFYNQGRYKINFNGNELSSGVYFYSIKSGDYYQTKKMILIK